MYKARRARPVYFDYDLIVIGSGAGGGVASHLVTRAGKKVAVIEAEKIGGECPNFGCVPTKALLQAADTYRTVLNGKRFGIEAQGVKINYETIKAWKDTAVRHTGTEEGQAFYDAEGIKVIHGQAHFIDPWTVTVGHRRYQARHFLIATGTKSVIPPIPGLSETGFMTYRQAIDVTALPKSLFVIGGGAIGSEFAHLFNSLGSEVHIADMTPHLIGSEDSEVGELIGALFKARGMHVHNDALVTKVAREGQRKVAHFEKDGKSHQVKVEEILVASGKAPNTDLGLENAGVAYARRGITTNGYMQTSAKHIYAAGDVVGPYGFTHTASYQSRIAANNMMHPSQRLTADYHAVPRCVFVEPEIACVGYTEQQLKTQKITYQTAAVPINVIGRANTAGIDSGFVKILAGKYGTLLGASIVSPRAGEMIHELTLAIQHGMKARAVVETIHAFPTWSEAVRVACLKINSK